MDYQLMKNKNSFNKILTFYFLLIFDIRLIFDKEILIIKIK
jgi:hypothetical protein